MIGIYIRVSTEKQAVHGHSAYEQKSKAIKYIHDTYGTEQCYKLYDDSGYSGKDFNRPGMKNLLQDILVGEINEVVFWSIDRISRNLVKMSYFIEHARDNDVKLTCLTSSVSTDTPEQFLFVMMQSLMAQYEREKVSERTIEGIQGGLRKGIYSFGGKAPFGYRRVGKELVINVSEANEIVKLFDLFLFKEMSVNSLIKYFNLHPTSKLPAANIPYILKNSLYCGKKTYKDEEFQVAPPIISEEVFNRVQQILNKKTKTKVNTYLFSGKLMCHACGKQLISVSTNKKNKTYLYYMCNNKKCTCFSKRISETKTLEETYPTLEKLLKNKYREFVPLSIKEKKVIYDLKEIKKEIINANNKKSMATKLLIDGTISKTEYGKQIRQIDRHIEHLNQEYNIHSKEAPIGKSLGELSLDEKTKFIERHMPNINVDLKKKKLRTV